MDHAATAAALRALFSLCQPGDITVLYEHYRPTLPLAKPARFQCQAYLNWIRSQNCVICNQPSPSHAHHVFPKGGRGSDPLAGGTDLAAVPLCASHHTVIHSTCEHKNDIYKEALRLLCGWLINEAGAFHIMRSIATGNK